MDVNKLSDNGLSCSGGLEELFTDFDCWITRWNIRLKKRSPANTNEIIPVLLNNDEENSNSVTNKLQDLLVNGFSVNKTLLSDKVLKTKDSNRLDLQWVNDLTSIDYIIIRLVKDNGRRRVVIINKSKL